MALYRAPGDCSTDEPVAPAPLIAWRINAHRRPPSRPPGGAASSSTNRLNSITGVQPIGKNIGIMPSIRPSTQSAHQRAGGVAQATEHGDDKGLELIAGRP